MRLTDSGLAELKIPAILTREDYQCVIDKYWESGIYRKGVNLKELAIEIYDAICDDELRELLPPDEIEFDLSFNGLKKALETI